MQHSVDKGIRTGEQEEQEHRPVKPFLHIGVLHKGWRIGARDRSAIFGIFLSKEAINQPAMLHELVHPRYAKFSVRPDIGTK